MNSDQQLTADVLVIGAGFAGLYAIHRARQQGLSVVCLEAGPSVGGTWYYNRYPGARCDVQSVDYSYSFDEQLQQDWYWNERYATQPEILAYINHVAERFDLLKDIRVNSKVVSAHYDEERSCWQIQTIGGEHLSAQHVLTATGVLSEPIKPDIPGIDEFAGQLLYTAQWPHDEPDLRDKRVGVIGTGSSGIQSIPIIANKSKHLTVFQRTANYSVPASNRPLTEEEQVEIRATYPNRRAKSLTTGGGSMYEAHYKAALECDEAERNALMDEAWREGGVLFGKVFPDQNSILEANDLVREYAEAKVRERVQDPQVAEKLIPTDHPIGAKRICTDSGYFETYNRDNVSLVNLRQSPIVRITPNGLETEAGHHGLDTLVFATGFDAVTGALLGIDIRGRDGASLRRHWADGPVTYLGMQVPDFPNLFNINGAGSPSVLTNMVLSAEQQINWVIDLILHAREAGATQIEARADAARKWTEHVQDVADATLFSQANSWYSGANIEGKPRRFMLYLGGFGSYNDTCARVKKNHYEGFVFSS